MAYEVSYEEFFGLEEQNCYQVFDDDGMCIDIVDTKREAEEMIARNPNYYYI